MCARGGAQSFLENSEGLGPRVRVRVPVEAALGALARASGWATHKGWCRSACSLLQYFWRNFSALSAASTEPGWLATARFTTYRGRGGQQCSGQPPARGGRHWGQALGAPLARWERGCRQP